MNDKTHILISKKEFKLFFSRKPEKIQSFYKQNLEKDLE